MGMFLSLTSIVGKTKDDIAKSLTNYTLSVDGGLEKENLSTNDDNCCVIAEVNGNATIFYPYDYLEWDRSAEFRLPTYMAKCGSYSSILRTYYPAFDRLNNHASFFT